MRTVYFFRHGQAGLRGSYDTLSEIGIKQAEKLGRYLASTRVRLGRIVVGALARQRATAFWARRGWEESGLPWPEETVDPDWNEFDIEGIFNELAPRMAAEDSEFRREYEEVRSLASSPASYVHRKWLPCDAKLLAAWLESRYPSRTESWPQFQARVLSAFERLVRENGSGDVAVFTSATPVGLALSRTLGFNPLKALQLAGVSYNTSITTIGIRDGEPLLISFNAIPHLPEPELATLR